MESVVDELRVVLASLEAAAADEKVSLRAA